MKERIKTIQGKIGVVADGIIGSATLTALEEWLGIAKVNGSVAAGLKVWPTQTEVRSGKSVFGTAGCESNLVSITPPYPLYYDGQSVRSIRVHKHIAEDVQAALSEVLAHYGQEAIHDLGLDVFDGAFNNRSVRGGSATSMHAWGIALDFDAAHNGNKVSSPKARFSAREYIAWFDIWERHGAVSMGRAYNRDWMHIQFAKFDV